MTEITLFNITIPAYIYAPVVYFVWVSLLLFIKKIIFGRVEKFASRTSSQLDDILLGALNFPLVLLIFVSGAFIIEKISPILTDSDLSRLIIVALKTTAILAIVLSLTGFLITLFMYIRARSIY